MPPPRPRNGVRAPVRFQERKPNSVGGPTRLTAGGPRRPVVCSRTRRMEYAFPAALAQQVIDRWNTFVSRHDKPAPPLPSPANLRHILETAFFTSLEREEGRDLRFVLCCAPGLDVARDGVDEAVPVMPIVPARPVSVETFRSLAPAVSPNNAALLVRFAPDAAGVERCELAGVVAVGSNLARARSGRSFYHRPAPYALLVDVREAGELHVYRGGIRLASLNAGRLHDQIAFSGLEFLPISRMLSQGEEAIGARLRPPAGEPPRETSDFQWTALLNTILSIVNGIRERGHGGTVLLVPPGRAGALPARLKFDVDDASSVLADRFVSFLEARHRLTEARLASRRAAGAPATARAELSHFESATFMAEEDLEDAADLVARLADVDGAVVLQTDLRVAGFGAEIVLDAAAPTRAREVVGHARRPDQWVVVDAESFGMRHRSALRCVAAAPEAAAFVVSQDRTVTFFWKQDGQALLKRDVNTANPNMVGA